MSTAELEQRALQLPDQLSAYMNIQSDEDYKNALGYARDLVRFKTQALGELDPVVDAAHQSHKKAVALRKQIIGPIDDALNQIKRTTGRWWNEQERQRREAEKRANEEAKLETAIRAEEAGDAGIAERILNGEQPTPPVVVEMSTPKVEGVAHKTNWKYRITDEMAIPRDYLVVDTKKIGQVVRAMKGKTRIPGVEPYEETGVAIGSR